VSHLLRSAYVPVIRLVLRFIELLLLRSCFIEPLTPSRLGIQHRDISVFNSCHKNGKFPKCDFAYVIGLAVYGHLHQIGIIRSLLRFAEMRSIFQ
jgi:hypothetical protein